MILSIFYVLIFHFCTVLEKYLCKPLGSPPHTCSFPVGQEREEDLLRCSQLCLLRQHIYCDALNSSVSLLHCWLVGCFTLNWETQCWSKKAASFYSLSQMKSAIFSCDCSWCLPPPLPPSLPQGQSIAFDSKVVFSLQLAQVGMAMLLAS